MNMLIYIITLLFGACCAFLMLLAKLIGWTYTEACVYVNLYLQYVVLILSSLSIVYVALKKISQKFSTKRLFVLLLSVLYNIPFIGLGVFIYQRYGITNCDVAFERCKNDLWFLGTQLDIPTNLPYYREGWTEYYIVNIIIFIVLYLIVLMINWWCVKLINK